MKYQLVAALSCCALAGIGLGADPPQKKAAVPSGKSAPVVAQKSVVSKKPPQKTVPQKTVAQKTVPQKNAAPKAAAKKSATPVKAPPVASHPPQRSRYASYRQPVRRPATQQAPSADRYKEIQDALAAQGYLKTPSNGVWDKDSVDAMQRFQKDKNLEPTGKLTARSLGELGLGPKPPETASLPPNPPSGLAATPPQQ